jgi:spermidine synthase
MRHLALFFGSDVFSAAIGLSAFMGGLSLGSYIAENVVDRIKNPLLYYGIIEIIIGLYAFFFNDFLFNFKPFLKDIYQEFFLSSPALYQGVRIFTAASALILPTALMGATLPLIVKGFVKTDSELGRYAGFFYSINTFGALIGTLIAAFFLLPVFGVSLTTKIGVVINIMVGVLAIIATQSIQLGRLASGNEETIQPKENGFYHYDEESSRMALLAIFFSGLAALALEVVLTRILALSFSTTVYSFPIMLSCFLFGIFFGSNRASKTIDSQPDLVQYFGLIEILIALAVMSIGLLTYLAPGVFGKFLWLMVGIFQSTFGIASVISKFVVSALLIIFPAILLGATFPIAVKICTPHAKAAGFGTGRVYAANTAGSILGSLLAGFILIPYFGSRFSFIVISCIFLAIGMFLLFKGSGKFSSINARRQAIHLGVATLVVGVGIFFLPRQTVLNYNLQSTTQPELIYHGEGTAHSIDIVRSKKENIIMMVDGNIEADTSYVQRRHFILKGHLPIILRSDPSDVAVVGLGLGITLTATEKNPESQSISLIELNPEMVEAHEYLKDVTGDILKKQKISLRIDDGRNFFSMTDQKFDIITADPIHPRISGVGYLFTKEYYQSIKNKLRRGGVICQWMPMYRISKKSFDVAFRTFSEVFENSSFWYVRGHGLFVASLDEFQIDYPQIRRQMNSSIVAKDLNSIGIHNENEFLAHMLMGPNQIKTYLDSLEDTTINTDNNAYLEYQTPSEFMKKTKDIVEELLPWAGFDPHIIQNISDADRIELEKAWEKRKKRVLPELEESLN